MSPDNDPRAVSRPGTAPAPAPAPVPAPVPTHETLDPADWDGLRALGHRMVDDLVSYHRAIARGPAWRPPAGPDLEAIAAPIPEEPGGADETYDAFLRHVRPYAYGNIHPRAWGWVNGTGSTLGAMTEMLAAGMNPNVWGGHHGASAVEEAVLAWARAMVGFPEDASGVLVSGGSVANLVGLAVARDARAGEDVSGVGVRALERTPVVYASEQVHNSVDKAVGLLGLGWSNLRRIPVDGEYRMEVAALEDRIAEDRRAGLHPIFVVATAGTVNTGAVDPLGELADLADREGLWLHVDGAFGAVAALSPLLRPLLQGLERADSVAFDFHKWLHVPIDAACVLVRRAEDHTRPFSPPAAYLERFERGLTAGPHVFSVRGPELTRAFRALKIWMSLRAHGTGVYRRLVEQDVAHARHLEGLVRRHPRLELTAPVPLNVVCFRWAGPGDVEAGGDGAVAGGDGAEAGGDGAAPGTLDRVNRELLVRLQESGEAVVSSTRLGGVFTLRAAFTNHRTRLADVERLVEAVARIGDEVAGV